MYYEERVEKLETGINSLTLLLKIVIKTIITLSK